MALPLKGGFAKAGWALFWSSLLFSEMKEALNSDNAVGRFWFLIVDKYFILHFKFIRATKSLKMKKNSILGHPFAGLFLGTHLFSFYSTEVEAPWQLATDSSCEAVGSRLCGWVPLPPSGDSSLPPFQGELKSSHYLPSSDLAFYLKNVVFWSTCATCLHVLHSNEEICSAFVIICILWPRTATSWS